MPASVLDLIIRSRKQGKGAKEAETGLNKLTKAAQLAAVAGFAVLTAAAIKFLKSSIDISSQMEEMKSKFNVVFGQEAPRAAAFIDELANRVGRSRLELTKMAASLQDTFVPMGLTRDAAADLALQLTELATDVGSFNDVASGDVARDFQSALVGNTETVRKYGIVITEANTKQAAYRLGIAEVGAELTDQQKLLTRVQLLFEGTSDAQGDAERTADSLANTQRRLAGEIENLQLLIGGGLSPALADLLGWFADTLHEGLLFADALQLLDDRVTRLPGGLTLVKGEGILTKEALIELAAATREAQEAIKEETFAKAAGAVDGWRVAMQGAASATEGAAEETEEARKEVLALADAARERVGPSFSSMAEAIGQAAGAIDTNLTGSIGRFLDQMEFFIAGGGEIQAAFMGVQEALAAGEISPEQAQGFIEELFVAAQNLETDLGNITANEAAANIREQLGGSLSEAKERLAEIDSGLLSLPDKIQIQIEFVQLGAIPDFQHGGQFQVPGTPSQAVPVAFQAHGRETVTVTPSGGTTNNSMEFGRGMIVNVFGQDDEQLFLDKLRRAAGKL